MATDIKSSAQSTLHSAKSTLRDASSNLASEASPRIKEVFDQISEVTSDLYSRANSWLSEEQNKKYGIAALVAAVGIMGFVLGRSTSHDSSAGDLGELE